MAALISNLSALHQDLNAYFVQDEFERDVE